VSGRTGNFSSAGEMAALLNASVDNTALVKRKDGTTSVDVEGALVCRSTRSNRWKRRFAVLNGVELKLYRSDREMSKPRAELNLTSNSFVKVVAGFQRPFCFEVATDRQVLVASAEDEEAMQRWIASFNEAIAFSRHRDNTEMDIDERQDMEEEESKARDRPRSLFRRLKGKRRNSTSSCDSPERTTPTRNFMRSIDFVGFVSSSFSPESGEDGQKGRSKSEDQGKPSSTARRRSWSSRSRRRSSSASLKSLSLTDPYQSRPTHRFNTPATIFEVDTRYNFLRPIGTGAYGIVVSAHDDQTKEDVAIKKVSRAFEDLVDAKRILREIKLLRHFDHENIIHIKDLMTPRSYTDFENIYIVSELMETDLHRVIYSKQKLTQDHIQYFIYQTMRALKYIHSANVIHRDIKPSNLLLNANCDLKVCDFGLARGLEDSRLELTEYVVTRWYRAPEIMLACRKYTKAIDVWAVGCIFAELLVRKPLFPGEDYIHQIQLIIDFLGSPSEADMHFIKSEKAKKFMRNQPVRAKSRFQTLFPGISREGLDLMDRMLQFDPAKRISVDDALAHPYLASLHQPDDEPVCPTPFLFDDNKPDDELEKREIQDQILLEVLHFHPEDRARLVHEAQQIGKPTLFSRTILRSSTASSEATLMSEDADDASESDGGKTSSSKTAI